jgi:16S rRNA (guanine527-N7)-methyltransferase
MSSREKPDFIQDLDPVEGKRLLTKGAESLGIALSADQLEQFMSYLTLLGKWNRHINLTGLRSCREIIIKHFLDSLTPLPYLPEEARLLDLGSGAGFPGLPIKIVRPNQTVTLIEASAKKVSFLKEAARHLNLSPVPIFHAYLGEKSSFRFQANYFEIIISRAVGNIINLLTEAYPYLTSGGKLLLMKGRHGPEEISALWPQIQERGFRIETPIILTLPFLEQERHLIFLTKVDERKS